MHLTGSVAHLGERIVRNDEVGSSSLLRSTINTRYPKPKTTRV